MIEILSKNRAKLIVSIGSGKKRKRHSKIVEYSGKKQLKELYAEFEKQCLRPPLTDITVPALVTSYIENCKIRGAKETTTHGYETAQKRIEKRFEGVLAVDLTAYQVEDFVSYMADKYAPKTTKNTIALLSASYDRAIRTGQLEENPCRQVDLPKQTKKDTDLFTQEEVQKFLTALEDETLDYRVGFKLALLCGLRRSEILGLREEHINIPFRAVTVASTRHRVSTDDVVQDTKTDKSRRVLALPDSLVSDISALIAEHHALEFDHTDYLIQNGFGEPMNPSTFSNRIFRIEDDANLPHVSLHDLRHTFASMLNSASIDIARISRELGHSNPNVTLGIYTHIFGNVSDSSRGIAEIISEKTAPFLPLEKKGNA